MHIQYIYSALYIVCIHVQCPHKMTIVCKVINIEGLLCSEYNMCMYMYMYIHVHVHACIYLNHGCD